MSPPPTLHHFASQPDLTLNRQGYYDPQTDRYVYSGSMRATPSIPNLRYDHRIPSPSEPLSSTFLTQFQPASSRRAIGSECLTSPPLTPGVENIGHRPLPKPLKTRAPTLAFIQEPSNRQVVTMVPSASLSHVPQSAPLLETDCNTSWVDGAATTDHQTATRAMDRSDTLTSVKSLDRWDLSQNTKQKTAMNGKERPLPSTPEHTQARGLALSRSLDRGTRQDGTLPPRILALTSTTENQSHSGFKSSVKGGMMPVTEQASSSSVSYPERTHAALVSAGQPSVEKVSNTLETLQGQIISAMADFRNDDTSVTDKSEAMKTAIQTPMEANRSQTGQAGNQADVEYVTQVAAMPLNGIPTIVFPHGEDESEVTVTPSARASSPGPFAGYASAAPAIVLTITTDDAEETPTPAIFVSEENISQANKRMLGLPVSGTSVDRALVGETPSSSQSSPATCGLFCHACNLVILGSIVNAMQKGWHPGCFRCTTCKMPLEHVSSFEHEGKPYCHMDYHENVISSYTDRNVKAAGSRSEARMKHWKR
ncbi:hypothetical protein QFC24_004638 [Naganishia onofrii]|uniref:Uncharacterized protein n=1 Tax=Naganishia onofrii TaxID=1851511 RepID=A0ACC2XDE1_9TREE|nr:hypothetical protein QFC24_004638 [Naganishia onofrii]